MNICLFVCLSMCDNPDWLSPIWLKRVVVLVSQNTTVRLSLVHGSVSEVPEVISSASLWR